MDMSAPPGGKTCTPKDMPKELLYPVFAKSALRVGPSMTLRDAFARSGSISLLLILYMATLTSFTDVGSYCKIHKPLQALRDSIIMHHAASCLPDFDWRTLTTAAATLPAAPERINASPVPLLPAENRVGIVRANRPSSKAKPPSVAFETADACIESICLNSTRYTGYDMVNLVAEGVTLPITSTPTSVVS
jgi:hypothetical protein